MINSLEMRAPFLDLDVMEFAFNRVPSNLKATHSEKKILLKMLAKRVLPLQFDYSRKQGFSIPINKWLRDGVFQDFFRDTLLAHNGFFNQRIVASLLEGQKKGYNNGERLFGLVIFELWRKEYGAYL